MSENWGEKMYLKKKERKVKRSNSKTLKMNSDTRKNGGLRDIKKKERYVREKAINFTG